MTQLTLGKIAALYGMHRSSVYEAVDKGRVTATPDLNGRKVIDLSEAIRCWGEPKGNPTAQPDSKKPLSAPPVGQPDSNPTPMTEATALRLAAAMERLIEIEEAKLLMLEHKPAPRIEHEPTVRPQSFADLLASFD